MISLSGDDPTIRTLVPTATDDASSVVTRLSVVHQCLESSLNLTLDPGLRSSHIIKVSNPLFQAESGLLQNISYQGKGEYFSCFYFHNCGFSSKDLL